MLGKYLCIGGPLDGQLIEIASNVNTVVIPSLTNPQAVFHDDYSGRLSFSQELYLREKLRFPESKDKEIVFYRYSAITVYDALRLLMITYQKSGEGVFDE